MVEALVITPVKNSVLSTIATINAIAQSSIQIKHIVYNDFSDVETKNSLIRHQSKINFQLINLEDIISTPSPNYRFVLQNAQEIAIAANIPLIIVESDVKVNSDSLEKIIKLSKSDVQIGMVGAITVDKNGKVNFPYLKFKDEQSAVLETKRSLSFCCTLLSVPFLKSYSFENLDLAKDWFDVHISKKSIELGFKNFIRMDAPVLHQPHGSRPWKQLKYTNPIKYYFLKLINRRDKI